MRQRGCILSGKQEFTDGRTVRFVAVVFLKEDCNSLAILVK